MKNFFRRYVPEQTPHSRHKHLAFIGTWLKEPNLWHLNRRSVAGGVAAGLFCAFLPMPGQMLLAAIIAAVMKGNIILAGTATWLSNPITYIPIYYFNYQIGNVIIGNPLEAASLDFSMDAILENIRAIGVPLVLGSALMGLLVSVIAYFGILVSWRVYVLQLWEKRKSKRLLKRQAQDKDPLE